MPNRLIKALPLLGLAVMLAGCGVNQTRSSGSTSAAAPPAGTVLLSVNGEPITSDELNAYIKIIAADNSMARFRLSAIQRYRLTQELMRVTLAAQDAEKRGLDKKPDVQATLEINRKLYLAGKAVEYFDHTAKVPESVLRQKYREKAKELSGNDYELRQITLKSKAEADKIISKLARGGNFSELAKKYSTDPAAKRGGELGWLRQKPLQRSEPKVFKAVSKLKKGGYTKTPIETSSGWLVVELKGKTVVPTPKFSDLKHLLETHIKQEMTERYLKKLESSAVIHWNIPKPVSAATAAHAGTATTH